LAPYVQQEKAERQLAAWNIEEINQQIEQLINEDNVRRIIVKFEKGSISQYPHSKGYLELREKETLWSMKRKISSETHWDRAQASREDHKNYCEKGGDVRWSQGCIKPHDERKLKR
jgi:hypothetical protein